MSYLFYKHYLQTQAVPPDLGGGSGQATPKSAKPRTHEEFIHNRERCIDDELAASMPASDPPSWTLGGSTISKRKPN